MTYRRQDANGDMVAGRGLSDFLTGNAAVAQAIMTWMLLLYGEWWENLTIGFPLWQSIMGQEITQSQADSIIQTQIMTTPTPTPNIITGIASMESSLANRAYTFQATVNTVFGPVTVTNIPSANQGGS
jgi:hypothetical protein